MPWVGFEYSLHPGNKCIQSYNDSLAQRSQLFQNNSAREPSSVQCPSLQQTSSQGYVSLASSPSPPLFRTSSTPPQIADLPPTPLHTCTLHLLALPDRLPQQEATKIGVQWHNVPAPVRLVQHSAYLLYQRLLAIAVG